jgi:anhydro-N-acetylmuramic acid kinase
MNPQIARLHEISGKSKKLILGLMSGTSLDGLDMALCRFEGYGLNTRYEILAFKTAEYSPEFKTKIQAVFAQEKIHFPSLSTLNAEIGRTHARLIQETLVSWNINPADIDVIASHGQTVMHRPVRDGHLPHSTLQIGDGDHIAAGTGIITLSDFRQKHVAAGGEGAPLAVYGDYFLFSKAGQDRVLLNMGGIGNFTYLSASGDAAQVLVTDTGPGNTLIDACVRKHFPGLSYDEDGKIGWSGECHEGLLDALMAQDFFREAFPKSTGPEYFHLSVVDDLIEQNSWSISPKDLIRTLTEFTAQSIVLALKTYVHVHKGELIASGGGSRNPLIMKRLAELSPTWDTKISDAIGIPSGAKEALLFALLANETLSDAGAQAGRRLGDSPWVTMGKISFPF